MRLSLDLDTGVVAARAGDDPVYLVDLNFGQAAFEFQLFRSGALAQLIPLINVLAAKLQLLACPPGQTTQIVAGNADVSTLQTDPSKFPILNCAENWGSVALGSLLAVSTPQQLNVQMRWRNGGDPVDIWSYSRQFQTLVRKSLYAVDPTISPPSSSGVYKLDQITRITGGVSPTDFDAFPVAAYASLSRFDVVTDLGGGAFSLSSWQKRSWTGGGAPVTDAPGGTIKPVDWNNTTNNFVLIRIGGL